MHASSRSTSTNTPCKPSSIHQLLLLAVAVVVDVVITIISSPYGSMEEYLVYCVFVIFCLSFFCLSFFVRLQISQWWKKLGAWNFACVLAYYLDRSSPLWWTMARKSHGAGGTTSRWTPNHPDIEGKVERMNAQSRPYWPKGAARSL